MLKFDGTITLGAIVSAATFAFALFVAYTKATQWLERQFATFEMRLAEHGAQLKSQTERMGRYEERYVAIANDLQWLIGRMDGDRRQRPRHNTDQEGS